jgi:hypothetical protein
MLTNPDQYSGINLEQDLIICDVNADGKEELVVSLTDRVVRNYRWCSSLLHRRQSSTATAASSSSSSSLAASGLNSGGEDWSNSGAGGRRLVCVNKWEFASQIGTITTNTGRQQIYDCWLNNFLFRAKPKRSALSSAA